jgi:cytochrome c-type biogenesis protein CcmH
MWKRVGAFVVVAVPLLALLVGLASGQQALEDRVRAIASQLRCPVCQNLSVADSPSEMAQQMRAVIRERLAAGQSRGEIEGYFVGKYGQWILLSPRRSGFNLVLWIGPFAAAALGLLIAARLVHRWSRRRGTPAQTVDAAVVERVRAEAADDRATASVGNPGHASPLERERARLYEALRELAFDHHAGKLSAVDYEATRADYEARAATVLLELDAGAARGGVEARPEKRPTRTRGPGEAARRRRPLRAALAGGFLLVFGVTVGVFLSQGLRPRGSSMDSITGDFLTGTGPGGMSPTLSFRSNTVERNLMEGRAAFERQDFRMAIDHFKSVLDVEPDNPVALSYLGTVLWRGGHAEAGLEAVERALRIAPDYPLALWTKGLALYEGKGDYRGAIQSWETLMRQPLAPADADAVARMIAEARQQLASGATGSRAKATLPTPTTDDGRRIAGTVILADSLRGDAPAGGALFVIARRGGGPPLAVKKIVDPTFPVPFALGPDDVMVQGTQFAGEVTLVARLKRDGRAGAATRGDLEGAAPGPIAVGTTGARITLEAVR